MACRKSYIIGILGITALAAGGFWSGRPSYELQLDPGTIFPTGENSTAHCRLVKKQFGQSTIIDSEQYSLAVVDNSLSIKKNSTDYLVYAAGKKGVFTITALVDGAQVSNDLYVVLPFTDNDQDGFPDVAELSSEGDRQAFRNWFGAIAESQYQKISYDFYPQNHDCAGLIRYAYVQALMAHTPEWSKWHPIRMRLLAADVGAYTYPQVPELGHNLFLQGSGDGSFGPFADAATLMQYNCRFIGYDPAELKTGDLLFYAQTNDEGDEVWHSMIFLAAEQFAEDFVVYHTGPVGSKVPDGSGEVRKVLFSELTAHPDSSWHPVKNNSYFRGFYRFKILE